jgi:hypothetical protein
VTFLIVDAAYCFHVLPKRSSKLKYVLDFSTAMSGLPLLLAILVPLAALNSLSSIQPVSSFSMRKRLRTGGPRALQVCGFFCTRETRQYLEAIRRDIALDARALRLAGEPRALIQAVVAFKVTRALVETLGSPLLKLLKQIREAVGFGINVEIKK